MAKLLSESTAKWLTDLKAKATATAGRAVRTPFVGGSFFGWRQWHCSIADGKLRVRSGSLAWGGGHYAVWPSGRTVSRSLYSDIDLGLDVNAVKFLIWYTKAAPCPLTNCPKSPNGNTTCPAAAGDPSGFNADSGTVAFFDSASRGSGWTDYHVIAAVERTSKTDYVINQIQTAEIAVNAIVYPGETGEEPETPGTEPPCGHPGNEPGGGGGVEEPGDEPGGGTDHPGDEPPGDEPGAGTDHPGDEPGGVTPPCGGDTVTP
jgi:hypothetical protein